jgi:hypothetical protein
VLREGEGEVIVRVTQIDGKLPNVALMKLAHWHKARGDAVVVTRDIERGLFEPKYDRVYGSAIFTCFGTERVERFLRSWPEAIVGGTGTFETRTVEEVIGVDEYEHLDYAGWPDFPHSIGFTQRGCRLKCKFCVVPKKEGKNRGLNTIAALWRGAPWPKNLLLLDNDFFGQPDWRGRIAEIRAGDFRVCFSQGINVRLIDDDAAAALATIKYRDTKFTCSRLYTAWDNLRDEKVFFSGVDRLERHGIPPTHLMAYMLVGYDPLETWERLWHRFNAMVARGVMPYVMVYHQTRKDLKRFQRWANLGLYRVLPFEEYHVSFKGPMARKDSDLFVEQAVTP